MEIKYNIGDVVTLTTSDDHFIINNVYYYGVIESVIYAVTNLSTEGELDIRQGDIIGKVYSVIIKSGKRKRGTIKRRGYEPL